MFDFLESDWFNISLEILFLLLVSWDVKKYLETGRKEYILNIAITLGFAVWALWPYYNSYVEWNEKEKKSLLFACQNETNLTLCKCMDDAIFKNYTHDEYVELDKNGTEFRKFLKEAKDECEDDSWF